MLWVLVAGCFVITEREIRVHDARIDPPAADTGPEDVRVTLVGSRLGGLRGLTVRAAVVLGGEVVTAGEDTIEDRQFRIEFPGGLEPGVEHRVDVLIDGDGDGICVPGATGGSGWTTWTSPSPDLLFRIRGVSADEPGPLEVELDQETDADEVACGSFVDPA